MVPGRAATAAILTTNTAIDPTSTFYATGVNRGARFNRASVTAAQPAAGGGAVCRQLWPACRRYHSRRHRRGASRRVWAYLEGKVAAAEIALSDNKFDTLSALGEQSACCRLPRDRLRWQALQGASQTVGEQSGERRRVLGYAAFGEKGCTVQ